MPSVLLVGAFGQGNPGDEALCAAFVTALGAADVVVASGDPGATARRHGVRAIADSPAAVARELHRCDAVVVGGGTVFKTLRRSTSRRPTSLLRNACLLTAAAKATGKHVAFVGVGAGDLHGRLARALARSTALPVTDDEPPAQFLDVDDLAAAADLARRDRLDGPRNVAPDGWISGDTVRSLAGGAPRVRLPERLALRLAGLRWRWRLAPTPPSLLPFTVHPWVIANDRLRADGWQPASSNEEAYVGAHRAGPWATLSPRRRQELALGAAGAALLGGVAVTVVALRRRRR